MASVSTRSSTTRSYTYYVHCRCNDVTSQTSAILRLENCIEEVSHWMSANRLKLNADKTELLLARSRHSPALLESAGPSLQLGTETVAASDEVRVLGVTLTSDLCCTLPASVRRAFTGFANSDGVRRSLDVYVGPRSFGVTYVWTTATPFSLGHQVDHRQARSSSEY